MHKFHVNLHVSTYNIHKGFSQFNRRMMIRELRDHLQLLGADIIFLQEVQGLHSRHAARFEDWPEEPQYEFLADQVWPEFACSTARSSCRSATCRCTASACTSR